MSLIDQTHRSFLARVDADAEAGLTIDRTVNVYDIFAVDYDVRGERRSMTLGKDWWDIDAVMCDAAWESRRAWYAFLGSLEEAPGEGTEVTSDVADVIADRYESLLDAAREAGR